MRNRVGLPNRGSARNRTYPGRTSPPDSGREDQKRAKARLWRRQSTQRKVEAIRSTRTDAQGRTNVSLARREAEPTVGWTEAEGRGRHLRVAALFQSGLKVDAASIPGSKNVASADVVGTGREVGESRTEACRTACRVVCGRAERTGGTVHYENARACTSGEIGRGGIRIRAETRKGIAERQVGQQWLAGRDARVGSVAMMQFER